MNGNQVVWKFADSEVEENQISIVENVLGIKFPQDYIECAKKNNGGHPVPDIFYVDTRGDSVFNYLLSYDHGSTDYILDVYHMIQDRLVNGVYPIADDPFGNHICFDYREKTSCPSVVFWDHELAFENPEKAIFPICSTFTELLSKLYME